MNYYFFCPNCQFEENVDIKNEPRKTKIGTDGWGQPVKFTECKKCENIYMGFLNVDFYTNHGEGKFDFSLKNYLKHRINFYYNIFTNPTNA